MRNRAVLARNEIKVHVVRIARRERALGFPEVAEALIATERAVSDRDAASSGFTLLDTKRVVTSNI